MRQNFFLNVDSSNPSQSICYDANCTKAVIDHQLAFVSNTANRVMYKVRLLQHFYNVCRIFRNYGKHITDAPFIQYLFKGLLQIIGSVMLPTVAYTDDITNQSPIRFDEMKGGSYVAVAIILVRCPSLCCQAREKRAPYNNTSSSFMVSFSNSKLMFGSSNNRFLANIGQTYKKITRIEWDILYNL